MSGGRAADPGMRLGTLSRLSLHQPSRFDPDRLHCSAMTATDERELRPVRPRPASAHVTVYREDGTPVQYPKAQIDRIEKSEIFFLEDPTEVDPGETPKPKPTAKAKKPSANKGAK